MDDKEARLAAHRAFDNAYCAGLTTYQAVEEAITNYITYANKHTDLKPGDMVVDTAGVSGKVGAILTVESVHSSQNPFDEARKLADDIIYGTHLRKPD